MTELKNVARYVTDKIDVALLNTPEYITTDNMIPNRGGVTECDSLPQAVRVTRYAPGDTLVSNIRPYFKKIWYADRVSGCSNDVIVFRPINENWDHKFLYYVLSQDAFFDHMMSGANGTKMPRGNKKTIPDFLVPDFDYEKQTRISETLSAYDDLIENNQKQIKLLEEAAQRLYKEWFVDLRFPGYEDTPIVDGVPEGWERLPVGELIEKISRTTQIMASEYGKEGPIPIIDQSREFIAGYTDNHASLVNVGKPVIVFGDHTRILKYIQFPFAKGADGTQLIVSNTDRMPQSLFYCSLVGVDLSNYHYARHFKYLKAEELLVPTQVIAEAFDRFVSPMFSKIQRLRDINKAATNARDRLLPKLMSGEIEV